ncbi:MAG: DNA-formamidopyrimidine glycosylase family protein [Planctomycetota bacterium]
MPELPDVAVFARRIRAACGRTIDRCSVNSGTFLAGVSQRRLCTALAGAVLGEPHRHGKQLFLPLDDGPTHLALHFGMTGGVAVDADADPAHTRLRCDFTDGGNLCLTSQRLLGHAGLTEDLDAYLSANELGPDALDLGWEAFRDIFRSRRGMLKTALMDQRKLAGVGNVYADEICYQAGIDPRRDLRDLSEKELRQLHRTMQCVLHMAIERDADPDSCPRTWLLPNREEGRSAPRGDGTVHKIRVGGRGTYLVPERQR